MELLFLLKNSKLIKPKRMMKERYHSVPLFDKNAIMCVNGRNTKC